MRIVSQDGTRDFLYDNIVLLIDDANVIGNLNGNNTLIARYSCAENAFKAVEELHKHYQLLDMSVFQFPAEEDL